MKNKKVYTRLIITYLLVFLIPLMLNIVSLESISNVTKDNISKSVLANLTHARDTVDNNFREIDTIVYNLSANNTIQNISAHMKVEDKNIQISKLLSAQNYMSAMRIQTFVEEYYLLLRESQMIISPDHIFLDQASCEAFFQYDGMEWEEWEKRMQESYSKHIFPEAVSMQNGSSQNMILYVQSLITYSGVKGNFVFPIKSQAIKSLLKDPYVANAGWAYLTDKEGKVILTIPSAQNEFELVPTEYLENGQSIQEADMGGRSVEIIRSVSEETGLSFVAVLPQEYIAAQITDAQHKTVLLIMLAVVLGIVSILLVSWHRGRKIDQILQMLFKMENQKDKAMKGDEMSYISNSLRQLIHSNTNLKDSIREKKLVTRGLLLENLLCGMESRLDGSLEEYDIHLMGKKILVIAFQIHTDPLTIDSMYATEFELYKQVIQNGLEEILPGTKYACDIDIHAGAMICTMEQSYEMKMTEMKVQMEEFLDVQREKYGIRARIAVGNLCEEVSQINKIYDKIYEMLQYGPISERNVLLYEDYVNSNQYYYFPAPLEERLVNAVRTGNAKSMHEQLTEVYQGNVIEHSVSPSMMHFLVNDLQCTVFKVLHNLNGQVNIEEEELYRQIEQLNRESDILLRFQRINSIFKFICEKVQEENNVRSDRQLEKIEEYISRNYNSSDMSLTKISDDFGYASTYFSKLFKELFGENFANYLEKVRIEQVCLLLQTNATVEKIAEQTGYNSVYVMRTAFKRIKGATPNEYRKMTAKESQE